MTSREALIERLHKALVDRKITDPMATLTIATSHTSMEDLRRLVAFHEFRIAYHEILPD